MEIYHSTEISKLAKALITVQKELSPAMKDAKNPFVNSHYASLNSVMQSCRDALIQNGIWLTQLPVPAPFELGAGYIGLITKLTHAESGQWQSSFIVAPLPKNDPQGMGSALTYCRRYALTAMLGIVAEDDDGEEAKQSLRPSTKQRKTTSNTVQNKEDIIIKSEKDELGNLPQLKGIEYQYVPAQDGRQCIIVMGETIPHKEILVSNGFKWNNQRKCWWKYAQTA